MNYELSGQKNKKRRGKTMRALKKMEPFLKGERRNLALAVFSVLIWSTAPLLEPVIIARAIDLYIANKDFNGVIFSSWLLLAVYLVSAVASYIQTLSLGGASQRALFNLRNALFVKLQELPAAFFNQNRSGDLVSRINNDTDKLSQFIGQALMQLMRSLFIAVGAGIFLLLLNPRLGAAALIPAAAVLIATSLLSPWVERASLKSLQTMGKMSSEIQESLANFKVVAAFNRLDYFRDKFAGVNADNFSASVKAGIAGNVYTPIYGMASASAQLAVIGYGFYLISAGELTIGLLIGYLLYLNVFYGPLRQLATVWPTMQLAFAAVDRISEVMALKSDIKIIDNKLAAGQEGYQLEFRNVSFTYLEGKTVLNKVNLKLQRGKFMRWSGLLEEERRPRLL
jgi:ATP-binding cassette subfamily B protein